jgi:hypothetical protein
MKRALILLALLLLPLGAKEYRSAAVGYTLETSVLKDDTIQDSATIYNYAYRINSVYLSQNYLLLGEFSYYPWQKFAKGFQNGHRFESHIGQTRIDLEAGLKKYIIPYTYFAPTLGLRYNLYKSRFAYSFDNTNEMRESSEFDLPLILNFGYSLSPTSDLLIGYNIDEDLTDLKSHDYQEYIIRYFLSFKNNITLNAQYGTISKQNPDDMRQVIRKFSFTLGIRF